MDPITKSKIPEKMVLTDKNHEAGMAAFCETNWRTTPEIPQKVDARVAQAIPFNTLLFPMLVLSSLIFSP